MGGILGGIVLAAGALSGCTWTPRSETPAENTSGAEQNASTGAQGSSLDDRLVLVEGGSFTMGSPADEAWRGEDETAHRVTLRDFFLSPLETSQADFAELMGRNPSANENETLPVENVTWVDAIEYCNALSERVGLSPAYTVDGTNVSWDLSANGYRLPTEAEWEYACRAGTTTPFNTKSSINADAEANYYGTYPYGIEDNYFSQSNLETQPGTYRQTAVEPGSFPPNAWGLYDMHGNVAEWVWDAYGPYDASAQTDPVGPASDALRVSRGGGWNDFGKNLRSAYRAALPPDGSSPSVGFRVARNATPGIGIAGAPLSAPIAEPEGDTLVAFFSWSGNTRGIAQEIARQTGFRVVEPELEQPYSSNYNTVLEEAHRDQNAQARPALASDVDLEAYSTVLLGYPNWWASIPMPIASFLETRDFSGKAIVPFCSHGGGRFGQSLSAIAKLAGGATIGEGLSVHYSGGSSLAGDVAAWLDANGIAR